MTPQLWQDDWFAAATPLGMRAWRAVEAQHVVATMRLVDSLDEQAMLEQLLERSKPPLPREVSAQQHYLLSTPFRYRPHHGSRFRQAGSPGIWYGADSVRTACAEVAYWRWRFLLDSEGLLDQELLTEHTVFSAQVQGLAIDLSAQPWQQARTQWTQSLDYSATQAVAGAANTRGMDWLRYESVRDPAGLCCAVFNPQALVSLDLKSQQTWHCRTTQSAVRMVHGEDRYEWQLAALRPKG